VWLCAAVALACGAMAANAVAPAAPAPRTLAVAAAADLQFAMAELVTQFLAQHPDILVAATYGSSGNFYAQLSQRAPFDLFFSADAVFPARLTADGLTVANSEFVYGVGRLVVWVPRGSPLDVERLGLTALTQSAVRRIAIANPKHAPYGRAAEAAMRALGVYDRVRAKLVFGDNVAQAAQFVQTGAADVGILALSLAMAPPMREAGVYWEIPATAYPSMVQAAVILRSTRQPEAAQQFCDFVRSAAGQSSLARYGFTRPTE
jgi:molybdate transport system substrate-binding protein